MSVAATNEAGCLRRAGRVKTTSLPPARTSAPARCGAPGRHALCQLWMIQAHGGGRIAAQQALFAGDLHFTDTLMA